MSTEPRVPLAVAEHQIEQQQERRTPVLAVMRRAQSLVTLLGDHGVAVAAVTSTSRAVHVQLDPDGRYTAREAADVLALEVQWARGVRGSHSLVDVEFRCVPVTIVGRYEAVTP